jgi:hypothetical protein
MLYIQLLVDASEIWHIARGSAESSESLNFDV